jgi:hypothetical protein|tara:strand:+ start:964 stop:1179 length:216 start_codon:yes stop_codon:yes gene_type:complete
MSTEKEIKEAILRVAGNPDSGVVVKYADRWAAEIAGLNKEAEIEPPKKENTKASTNESATEVRVTKPTDLR